MLDHVTPAGGCLTTLLLICLTTITPSMGDSEADLRVLEARAGRPRFAGDSDAALRAETSRELATRSWRKERATRSTRDSLSARGVPVRQGEGVPVRQGEGVLWPWLRPVHFRARIRARVPGDVTRSRALGWGAASDGEAAGPVPCQERGRLHSVLGPAWCPGTRWTTVQVDTSGHQWTPLGAQVDASGPLSTGHQGRGCSSREAAAAAAGSRAAAGLVLQRQMVRRLML